MIKELAETLAVRCGCRRWRTHYAVARAVLEIRAERAA